MRDGDETKANVRYCSSLTSSIILPPSFAVRARRRKVTCSGTNKDGEHVPTMARGEDVPAGGGARASTKDDSG